MFLLDLVLFAAGWYYCYFHYKNYQDARFKELLLALPGTLLMYFGCYSLFSIGHGLFALKDCPEEYDQLQVDIARARQALAKKGL